MLLAAICGWSASAGAQTDTERAGARAAAQQGAQAYAEGRYEEAVDLFTRAESLVHAPPHLLYMARSYEKQGRLVKAREEYLKITREQLSADAPEAFVDAQNNAQTELNALEPRIAYVAVTVKPADASAQVMIDGNELAAALIGVETPIDPGKHRVVAVVAGSEGAPQEVEIAEGAHVALEVAPPSATPAAETAPPPTTTVADEGPSDPGQGLRIGSYVAFGVGAVGLGVGTVFLIKGLGKSSDADKLFDSCVPNCSTTETKDVNDLDDDAASAKTMAVVGYAVGAVGIGAGVTLLILSNKASQEASGASIRPWVGWQSAGVTGTF